MKKTLLATSILLSSTFAIADTEDRFTVEDMPEFNNWVELVKADYPDISCLQTDKGESVCSYLQELYLTKDKHSTLYTANIKVTDSGDVPLPNFADEAPKSVVVNGENVSFYIEKQQGRNIPFISLEEGEYSLMVSLSSSNKPLWVNQRLDEYTIGDKTYDANVDRIFFNERDNEDNQGSNIKMQYQNVYAMDYSEVPVWSQYLLVSPNGNTGMFEVDSFIPDSFEVFSVSPSHRDVQARVDKGNLKVNIKEDNINNTYVKVSSRYKGEMKDKLSFNTEEINGSLFFFSNQSLSNSPVTGKVKGENPISRNMNIDDIVSNIPRELRSYEKYILDEDSGLIIQNLENKIVNNNQAFEPYLSNIQTHYMIDGDGETVVEMDAIANPGVYRIKEGFSNVTAKIKIVPNSKDIPVALTTEGLEITVKEKQGIKITGILDKDKGVDKGWLFDKYNLPSSLIETTTPSSVDISSVDAYTPLLQLGEEGYSFKMLVLILCIAVLLAMVTSGILVPALYLLSVLTSSVVIGTSISISLISTALILGIGLFAYMHLKPKSFTPEKKVGWSKYLVLAVTLFFSVVGTMKSFEYFFNNKESVAIRHYQESRNELFSYDGRMAKGMIASDSVSASAPEMMMAQAQEKKLDISSWESPVGVSIPNNNSFKIPTYSFHSVKENVEAKYVTAYWLNIVFWLALCIAIVSFKINRNRSSK